jgi:hypothetical protein
MIVVDQDQRLTIDEVMNNEFFNGIRDLKEYPELTGNDISLREICDDFIYRGNVYKIDGIDKFNEYFNTEVRK